MAVALGGFLHGFDAPGGGALAQFPAFVARAVNALPAAARRKIYQMAGWWDAVRPGELADFEAAQVCRWATALYPARQYPAVAVGSSNGALAHLAAALGIPILPQTFLLPVRRRLDPDALREDLAWGRPLAASMLRKDPHIALHQMHDPIQDRLMVQRMGYFRLKLLRLGEAYERFISTALPEGGTILQVACSLTWPATRVQERHLFQTGGYGGTQPDDLMRGSPELAEFLRREGSRAERLDPPPADGEFPEAEWGFAPELADDLQRLADERGYRIRRLTFKSPDDLSPLVADLYRWWYARRALEPQALLGECFALLEPWWTLRTGAVPYWIGFNTRPSAEALERYLESGRRFREIHLMLLSNGIRSVGLVTPEQWKRILRKGTGKWSFMGMDEACYPLDLGSFGRFHAELTRRLTARYPLPEPLQLGDLDAFLGEHGAQYAVEWSAGPAQKVFP